MASAEEDSASNNKLDLNRRSLQQKPLLQQDESAQMHFLRELFVYSCLVASGIVVTSKLESDEDESSDEEEGLRKRRMKKRRRFFLSGKGRRG